MSRSSASHFGYRHLLQFIDSQTERLSTSAMNRVFDTTTATWEECENHTRISIYNLSNRAITSSSYACFWSSLRKESFMSCCHFGSAL